MEIPINCTHDQWCLRQAVSRVRMVLAAAATTRSKDQNNTRNSDKTSNKSNQDSRKRNWNKNTSNSEKSTFQKLSLEERNKLRREGKCFYCKKSGHMSNSCPEKNRNTPSRPSTISVINSIPETNEVIQFKKLYYKAIIPTKAHPTDAGYDLYSTVSQTILPGKSQVIRTGIAVQVPSGTYV